MSAEEKILAIIKNEPGITGAGIYSVRFRNSWAVRWFGEASIAAAFLAPGSGSLYPALARLENQGLVWSEWEERKPNKEYRSRRYYAEIGP